MRADGIDRVGEAGRVRHRELEGESDGLGGDPGRVEQARPGQLWKIRCRSGERGAGQRGRDGQRQMAHPGHQSVVGVGLHRHRPGAGGAEERRDLREVGVFGAGGPAESPRPVPEELRGRGFDAAAVRAGHGMPGDEARSRAELLRRLDHRPLEGRGVGQERGRSRGRDLDEQRRRLGRRHGREDDVGALDGFGQRIPRVDPDAAGGVARRAAAIVAARLIRQRDRAADQPQADDGDPGHLERARRAQGSREWLSASSRLRFVPRNAPRPGRPQTAGRRAGKRGAPRAGAGRCSTGAGSARSRKALRPPGSRARRGGEPLPSPAETARRSRGTPRRDRRSR